MSTVLDFRETTGARRIRQRKQRISVGALLGLLGGVTGGGGYYTVLRSEQIATARVEERIRAHARRLDDIEAGIRAMVTAQQSMAVDVAVIKDRVVERTGYRPK